MIDILKIFIPAFIFFAVIGGINGYSHDARQQVVFESVLKEIKLSQSNPYSLQFTCKENNTTYSYSVDTNKVKFFNEKLGILINNQRKDLMLSPERFNEHKALITTMLGGGTVGFTMQQAIKVSSQGWTWKKLRNTVAGFIGSVTGYYTGYWIGSQYDTDCASDSAISTLHDPGIWLKFERAFLAIKFLEMKNLSDAKLSSDGNTVYKWDENPAFMCSPKLKSLLHFLNSEIKDPTSEHYGLTVKIIDLFTKIIQTNEYQILIRNPILIHSDVTNKKFMKDNKAVGAILEKKKTEWNRACAAIKTISL